MADTERICRLCGQETPCCRCDYAQLQMAAEREVNFRKWVDEGRKLGIPAPRETEGA